MGIYYDVLVKVNDLRSLLDLIADNAQNVEDFGAAFVPDLIDALKVTSGTLMVELEKIGQSKELDYASELLKGVYPENV